MALENPTADCYERAFKVLEKVGIADPSSLELYAVALAYARFSGNRADNIAAKTARNVVERRKK